MQLNESNSVAVLSRELVAGIDQIKHKHASTSMQDENDAFLLIDLVLGRSNASLLCSSEVQS